MDYQKVRSARPALGRIRGRIQLRSEKWFLFLRFANCTTKKMWSCSPPSRRIRWNVSRQQGRQPAELSGEFVPLGGQEAPHFPRSGAPRIRHQVSTFRLSDLRELRFGTNGIRVPADLPEKYAQRALRRNKKRPMRSGGQTMYLDSSLRPRQIRK